MEQEEKNYLKKVIDFFNELIDPKVDEEETVIEENTGVKTELDPDYLARFNAHSIQSQNQLKGREESVELLKKAYQSWKDINNPLLMISEPGMGSSSLLHCSTSLYPHAQILEDEDNFYSKKQLILVLQKTLGLDGDFDSFEQMAKQINDEKVVIFENIERLFLRKVGGFSLLDDFLLFVHATKAKVYWVLTINRYSYYYLDRVRDFSSNFSSVLFLKAMGNQFLQEVLAERNQGFTLTYLPSKGKNVKLKDKSKEEKQEILHKEFDKKLLNFADGNLSRALLFWRKSIQRTSGKSVYLRPFEPKEMSDLSLEEVLILEAIMQHSSLSADELQEVFRNSSKGSQLAIEKLLEKDAVTFKEYHISGVKEYQINPLYTSAVKALLRNRLNRNIV